MKRIVTHFLIGVALVTLGWLTGSAQTTRGDFEIRVQAPTGVNAGPKSDSSAG
jgi:hypothetical protein